MAKSKLDDDFHSYLVKDVSLTEKEKFPILMKLDNVEIPKGYVGFLKSKSGLNIKDGITGEGVIDAGYTGSIKVKLYNNSFYLKKFKKGDKIIQLVILPIFTPELQKVDKFAETERGDNGFGSTGR